MTKQIQSLTNKAIKAHAAYRTARAKNLQPIQSPREVATNAKYQALKAELEAACREAGIPTPKTWNVY
jgi:hypothetical protein